MKREHCQKCEIQIEFLNKENPRHYSKKNQLNQIETCEAHSSNVYTNYYCNECWSKLEMLLQDKGYLPQGINSGFKGDND